jgi:hypothetical protein
LFGDEGVELTEGGRRKVGPVGRVDRGVLDAGEVVHDVLAQLLVPIGEVVGRA